MIHLREVRCEVPPTNLPASTGRWALHPHAAAGEEEGRGTAAIGKYRNAELSTKEMPHCHRARDSKKTHTRPVRRFVGAGMQQLQSRSRSTVPALGDDDTDIAHCAPVHLPASVAHIMITSLRERIFSRLGAELAAEGAV
ncbi:uncharacterized protein LOC113226364 [Hyposmocoma kahamanoa]|uniref:uncharacterized protein LOC113226364 n=1 Tax=Hyposmocoma kahamanoa TaxID=1477025 RepID=UPI000E6D6B54|nr:uncharacterized protein LOC113226364 [Hyposmocoma kahamanoa]XP_026314749.1 uncharacterized protein LOC113226364 [Hyposmocoma kahamanoa]